MKKGMFLLIVAVLVASGASATLVTDSTTFPPGALVIDFSQFTGAGQVESTNGPVQVGGLVGASVVFTSANLQGWVSNYNGWGLNANGEWTSARNGYASVDDPVSPMIFTFASPVSAIGGFMNYSPQYGSVTIEALGAGNVVLESYDVKSVAPISTPSGIDAGAFRGIVRSSPDIVAYRITGGYAVIDNLTFSAAPIEAIPATSTAGLAVLGLLLALVGVAALRARG